MIKPLAFGAFLALVGASVGVSQPTRSPAASDAVVMDPFDVTTVATKGYMATNTISGTAMNTPLKDVPMTINVITSEFLDDSLVGGLADALSYNSSITQTAREPINNRNDSWSIRGFRNRNTLVDGVTAGEFVAPQMIDRIEIVKGPNTLYGQSDPGGLINIITKRPLGKDRFNLTQKIGNQSFLSTDLDANAVALEGRLGLRVIGSHSTTDGYKVVDGKETNFVGFVGDYRVAASTRVYFHLSGNRTQGIPVQRGTYSFQVIPTDLNGDGDLVDTVNGIAESAVRYNNTFLPWNFTSQTAKNRFEQTSYNSQFGIRHTIGEAVNLQYTFVRTEQNLDMTFREYNTFNAAGSSDVNHSATGNLNRTDAHTLNALIVARTGGLKHNILAGVRYTGDFGRNDTYTLRALGPTSERTALANLISAGRNVRLNLLKSDVLNRVRYWEDDVPTDAELRSLGTRNNNNNVNYSESRVNSAYLTDSISLLENRLKLLGGVRYVQIRGQSTNLAGQKIGVINDQDDISAQGGSVFDLTSKVSVFANYATAFNPNGVDPNTGTFYSPETSEAYEAGFKIDGLWNGMVDGSVSYFNIDKSSVVRSDYNPVSFRTDTEISDDRSRGIETELFLNLAQGFQTVINYSYIDAKTVRSITLAKGLRLEGATPHRFTLWTSYGFEAGALKGLRFGGGIVRAVGPIQQFGTSNNRYVTENGYTTLGAFVRYQTKVYGRTLTLGANVDNATDEFYIRSRAGVAEPRRIVFSARLDL